MGATKSYNEKILWLSIIQGWAVLLVLIGHVNTYTYANSSDELYPLGWWIHRFCYAFHMPLFMFVSGGLLYLTRLSKDWTTMSLYKDKAIRLLIPYIAFSVIGFLIKAPFSSISKRSVDISFQGFLNGFFDPVHGPLVELWFIGTLIWLMLLFPLYKYFLKNPFTEIFFLIITLIPFVLGLNIEIRGWFNIQGIFTYAFYFFAGILFFKYDIIRYISGFKYAIILTFLFVCSVLYMGNIKILQALLGILMSFSWGKLISHIYPNLFHFHRNHAFQIFLFGLFPQMFVELIIWSKFHNELLQLPFYILSVLLALFFSVYLVKLINHIKTPWIRWCFGLKEHPNVSRSGKI